MTVDIGQPPKKYDLEDRTQRFSRDVRFFIRTVPKIFENVEDLKQLLRSSGSVAANYIEANEAVSKKDFYYRIRICRKESKESSFWIRSLILDQPDLQKEQSRLAGEAHEFELIFSAILRKNT